MLAVGLVGSITYLVIPTEYVVRDVIIYPGVELIAIIAIFAGVRRYRPRAPQAWLLIASGFTAYWVGDVIWTVYELQDREPFRRPPISSTLPDTR